MNDEAMVAAGYLRRHPLVVGLLVVLILYALAGFLLAPWILGRQLVSLAREQLGREAAVQKIEVNPFALSIRIQGLSLADTDGSRIIGLDDFAINFEAESLVRRAWTFSEVRLGGPYMKVMRDAAGAINLMRLVPPAAAGEAEPGGLPRLIVRRFALDQGVIDLDDQVPAGGFRTRVGPFSVQLEEFSTRPDEAGRHNVAVTFESGSRLAWAGDLTVTPLRSEGTLTLQGPFLGTVQRYVRDRLKFSVDDGSKVEMAAHYRLTGRNDGGIDLAASDVNASVTGLSLSAPDAPGFLGWSELRFSGGEFRWPAAEASLKVAALAGLRVKLRRAADGTLDLPGLLSPQAASAPDVTPPGARAQEPAPAAAGGDGAKEWKLTVGEAAVRDMAVDFTDAGPATPAQLSIIDLDLTLRDVSNASGARFPLAASVVLGGGGTIGMQGTAGVLPSFALDADLKVDGLALAQAQPWMSEIARIGIGGGALAIEGHLGSNDTEPLAFDGDIRIVDLDTRDLVANEKLLAWSELALDDMQVSLAGNSAKITRARLKKPFGRIFIARDQTTNVGALLVGEPPPGNVTPSAQVNTSPDSAAASGAKPFRVRVGKVLVSGGETDFTDLSLPLPFAARVQDLKGELTTIDTVSAAPSRIRLEGRVDEFGLARVDGQVRISSPTDLADIGVLFRNIEMPPLSPYTVKFAGRKIARGKINLDLRYKLDQRQMTGSNKIVIDELELGEKVPNPEAIDLPLGLAVALLKDANGRIDLDMPVSGSLDDPEFGIGSVIWKAFVNLMTKIVTSPFRLLGSLLGIESEDLGLIDFSPGRSDLLPPEREKLARISEALARRPDLTVEIPAVDDPDADSAALRTLKSEAMIEAQLAASGKPESGRGLEKRTRKVIETLYETRFPDQSLDAVQQKFQAPPPEDPAGKPRLDELAYLDELRRQLASVQEIVAAELTALGAARAAAISAELTATGVIAAERVRVGDRKEVKARDGAWIPVELAVGGVAE